jgi:hypothetical protein
MRLFQNLKFWGAKLCLASNLEQRSFGELKFVGTSLSKLARVLEQALLFVVSENIDTN